jgi:uncharacterized protein (TIGR02001 family)
MKKSTQSLVIGSVLAASTLVSGSAFAGGLSGNVGLVSDYFFRGIDQESGATASAGVDYDFGNGVAVGVWGADVSDGIEYDLYGSYSGEVNDFSYSVGFTTYNYTGEFDDTYQEINLGAGYGPVSLAYAMGTWDGDFDDTTAAKDDEYTFLSLTLEQGGAYLTYGTFGSDAEGSYVELGYGMEAGGFDVGVALINSDEDLSNVTDSNGDPTSEVSMVFSLGKSFDL